MNDWHLSFPQTYKWVRCSLKSGKLLTPCLMTRSLSSCPELVSLVPSYRGSLIISLADTKVSPRWYFLCLLSCHLRSPSGLYYRPSSVHNFHGSLTQVLLSANMKLILYAADKVLHKPIKMSMLCKTTSILHLQLIGRRDTTLP